MTTDSAQEQVPWSIRPGNAERIIAARELFPGKADAWIAFHLEKQEQRERQSDGT